MAFIDLASEGVPKCVGGSAQHLAEGAGYEVADESPETYVARIRAGTVLGGGAIHLAERLDGEAPDSPFSVRPQTARV